LLTALSLLTAQKFKVLFKDTPTGNKVDQIAENLIKEARNGAEKALQNMAVRAGSADESALKEACL
jgi:hypothetical protein